jgi:hypothetical protein
MYLTATLKRPCALAARALKAGHRRLGSGVSAGTAAVVAPAIPWFCAWADSGPETLIAAAAMSQAALLVIWARRCHFLWESTPDDTGDGGSGPQQKLRCCL